MAAALHRSRAFRFAAVTAADRSSSLDFLIIVDEVIGIPICLALYLSLRRTHESLMLIATAFAAISLVCYLVAVPALNMLYLSQQYAAATSSRREEFLAAGQAVLSNWLRGPCQVGYVVGSIAMILEGWVILSSRTFSKTAGWVGIVAGIVGFGLYVPKVGIFISIASVVGMQVWYVMIARTLFRLSSAPAQAVSQPERTATRMATD